MNYNLQKEINEISNLIEENKRLQKKYPDYAKSLQLGLNGLLEIEKEMKEALSKQKTKEDDITFIKDGLYLKNPITGELEEAVLYMSYDGIRCFDPETSVEICYKKDWERIHKMAVIRNYPNFKLEPVLYSMEYVESMLEWE